VVVALGLTALMVAVSGTARTSGYLRDKTIAQWIALNRLTQVRLQVNKLGDTQDTGQLDFAGRKWHYDTRYFDTQFQSMKRVVVRVYQGDAKTKGNPIAESTGFLGSSRGHPGRVECRLDRGLDGSGACPAAEPPVRARAAARLAARGHGREPAARPRRAPTALPPRHSGDDHHSPAADRPRRRPRTGQTTRDHSSPLDRSLRARGRGFTLIEILVALLILGIMSALGYETYRAPASRPSAARRP
jgi:general secretion pathway protein I